IREAVAFANQWQLPYKVMKVGYPDHPRHRLFVGLDVTRDDALRAYMQTFHFAANRGGVAGHLIIENYTGNDGSRATTPSMRTSNDPSHGVWSSKSFTGQWTAHWQSVVSNGSGYLLDHVIPLDAARIEKINEQFRSTAARDRCKTNAEGNCTEWI